MSETLTIGRRGFLGRTVAALAAAGTANVTAIAATRPPSAVVTERPELMEAGRRLDVLQAEWQTANALRLQARARAESLMPPVPEELLQDSYDWRFWTDRQCDVEGVPMNDRPRIIDASRLGAALESGDIVAAPRTKVGKQIRSLIKAAKKYQAETAAVVEQSGIREHTERVYLASMALQDLAWEVAKIEPLTLVGASIQARVLCAYVDAEDRHDKHSATMVLGLPLARSIARLTQTGR
jgi:hypothetical protein